MGSGVLRKLDDLGAERLADMDAAGIDMQILSHTYPSVETLDAAAAIPLARDANDVLAEAVAPTASAVSPRYRPLTPTRLQLSSNGPSPRSISGVH
jgi:predicted TIM-barrel fold metal-dependent hydrolase